MLSQVRNRLFVRCFPGGSFVDNALLLPSSVKFSTKKNGSELPEESTASDETPGSIKKSTGLRDDQVMGSLPDYMFDDDASPSKPRKIWYHGEDGSEPKTKRIHRHTSSSVPFQPKKVEFRGKMEKDRVTRNQTKQMKPGQLNIKMVEAAKTVASKAGASETEVFDDLMSKLGDDFVGMRHHQKKRLQKQAPKKPRKFDQDCELAQITEELFDNKSFQKTDTEELFDNKSFQKTDRVRSSKAGALQESIDELDIVSSVMAKRSSDKSFREVHNFGSVAELLGSEAPLDIFSTKLQPHEPSLKMWQTFEEKEVRRMTRFEPLNWFDQCIVWTEEGKLWNFPIDNEQGMDEEAKVDFTEHIFLDHHIESWCPKEGPIRHFMDIVLVGLSKNPFLSVAEKRESIEWYHQYFIKHQSLLEEINAFGSPQNPIQVDAQVN